jgi:hypothetical protein
MLQAKSSTKPDGRDFFSVYGSGKAHLPADQVGLARACHFGHRASWRLAVLKVVRVGVAGEQAAQNIGWLLAIAATGRVYFAFTAAFPPRDLRILKRRPAIWFGRAN